jgi:hypothetical protein
VDRHRDVLLRIKREASAVFVDELVVLPLIEIPDPAVATGAGGSFHPPVELARPDRKKPKRPPR